MRSASPLEPQLITIVKRDAHGNLGPYDCWRVDYGRAQSTVPILPLLHEAVIFLA